HQCRPAQTGRWAFTENHRADCYAYSCESQIRDLVRSLTRVRPYVFSVTAGRTEFAPTICFRRSAGTSRTPSPTIVQVMRTANGRPYRRSGIRGRTMCAPTKSLP
ncbi:MAG: hypothetical protein IJ071_04245, partial [Ruminococcus sp.]|nr:hypothetical protein [Ruminococcus sp.]